MTTLEAERKIAKLEKEVRQLRSFVIGQSLRDPEGNYRPEFVREILLASREKPTYKFNGRDSFLRQLKKIK